MLELLPALPAPEFSPPTSLGEAQVHLWLLDIRQFSALHAAVAELMMSADEQQRAQAFKRGKEDYIASRWLLRSCLARYTGTAPASIGFARTEQGKPFIPNSKIHFSLSHSGHWALLAVANTPLLGVDIEANRRVRDITSIAERYYHPQEYTQLCTLAADLQSDYFYRLWTLKEAFLKAMGTGISAGLDQINFNLSDSPISATINSQLETATSQIETAGRLWQFQQWQLEGDLIALACKANTAPQAIWCDALATPAFP